MIGTISVKETSQKPNFPLSPVCTFASSKSTVRISDVPAALGKWKISKVYVTIEYPDNSVVTQECTKVSGLYATTFEGHSTVGFTRNGFTVFADGTDENGNAVTNFVLGKGDFFVLMASGESAPTHGPMWQVHLLSSEPSTPNEGDMWQLSGGYVIWQDGEAHPLGMTEIPEAYKTYEETVESLSADGYAINEDIPTKTSQLSNDSGYLTDVPDTYKTYEETKVSLSADGYVTEGELSSKQDALTDQQLSAIDGLVEAKKTVVKYTDSSISSFDIVGTLGNNNIPNVQDAVEVTIGNAVTCLEDGAFYYCQNLSYVAFPLDSIKSFGYGVFESCSSLSSIMLNNGLTAIPAAMFVGCRALSSVAIPSTVASIGDYAFYSCASLTSLELPANVTSIGNSAFNGCDSLTSTVFKGKTLVQVEALANYPWGIADTSIMSTWNDASQEWVLSVIQQMLQQS